VDIAPGLSEAAISSAALGAKGDPPTTFVARGNRFGWKWMKNENNENALPQQTGVLKSILII
jgi:hypothetical protein